MRWLKAILLILITLVLVWALDRPWGAVPALGRLLDPINGAMANADPAKDVFPDIAHIRGLQQPVTAWIDDRAVPHIHAASDHDLYLVQGYLHAYFRLWQMDLQTRAAGGRVSEVVGEKALGFDRMQRRKGMVYGAEHSLKAMEAEPHSRVMLDAYRDGVNAFIMTLNFRRLPLEYKLMGFRPEPWTNLRTALLMKYMADDLTGATDDIALTWLRDRLSPEEFASLYPEKISGSKPVIPEGTAFAPPSLTVPSVPDIPDSLFAHFNDRDTTSNHVSLSVRPCRYGRGGEGQNAECKIQDSDAVGGIGSNNWAISGRFTASGAPILCNDPHLGLNLPSLWFEVQLQTPGMNVYGVSLPGAPGVVIGFNDSLSWGLTNNYRDVKDYYEIYPADKDHYWFNGQRKAYDYRHETIGIKGGKTIVDTVPYTVHGPVQYDAQQPDPSESGKTLAMTWMAHRPTNEMLALHDLNKARNYDEFVQAISHFECPAQNFVYADRAGNIALWGQGKFINKWKEQGRYVMEGKDSLTLWGQEIPAAENPHVLNPPQGYLASANQSVTDDTYPYYYNGMFYEFRSWRINAILQQLANTNDTVATVHGKDTALHTGRRYFLVPYSRHNNGSYSFSGTAIYVGQDSVQNDVHSYLADAMYPFFSAAGNDTAWNESLDKESTTATTFQVWWALLCKNIWSDDFEHIPYALWPSPERTMQLLRSDTSLAYYDDRKTPQVENRTDIIMRTHKETHDSLDKLRKTTGLEWYKVKNTTINHLTKIPAFGYTGLKIGGWGNTINAVKQTHGPSWRMIVEMGKDSIRAYGVYPGGQSGNPGSSRYADMLDHWVDGKYYRLLFLPNSARQQSKQIRHTWTFKPA